MPNLRELIKETYIDPIRSVLVIDDQFMSLDKLIEVGNAVNTEATPVLPDRELDLSRATQIINACREDGRNWLCDIHDGQNITDDQETKVVKHLHQCDLLILDYHLTPGDEESGEKALKLLSELATNGHFNLVVVYTSDDSRKVATDISLSFSKKTAVFAETLYITGEIEKWEDQDEDIKSKLIDSISLTDFAHIMQNPEYFCEKFSEEDCFIVLISLIAESPANINFNPKMLLGWIISKKQEEHIQSTDDFGQLNLNIEEDFNWIKTDRLFITVIKKEADNAAEIPDLLLNSLERWDPKPHRLMLARMRAELDRNGVPLEGSILNNNHTQAGWLKDFIESDEHKLRWVIKDTTSRLWQSLIDSMENEIVSFSEKLKGALNPDVSEVIKQYCGSLDITDDQTKKDIAQNINHYVCHERVTGSHLKTGQIISWENGLEIDYFLCLTPACDLVPPRGIGEDATGWEKNLGTNMPVKFVRLYSASAVFDGNEADSMLKLLDDINSNLYFLLKVNETITGVSIVPKPNASPVWEQTFAGNHGAISWDADNNAKIKLSRTMTNDGDGSLEFKEQDCKVIAQLRYEYALNFMQKLGTGLTRIGLDFQKPSIDHYE